MLGCEQLANGLGLGNNGDADAGAADGSASATLPDAGLVGGGCAQEPKSGAQLCSAISTCPNVVVDTQAFPSCGFRIHGDAAELVCGCGTAICPMGVFTTCAEATALLTQQTEQSVCVQVADGRCTESTVSPAAAATTSSSSSGGTNPACDHQCVKDCGGGAACASVCNCD
jgi:hypothetical protein